MRRGIPGSIVILGGGFGGIVSANRLRDLLGDESRITLIDRKSSFFLGLSKLWVMTGQREPGDQARNLGLLERKGIKVIQTEITKIDASARNVATKAGSFGFDYLVIALGAETAPGAVPGFVDGAHDLYDESLKDVVRLRDTLKKFDGGKLLITVFGLPFKCPPAPYEAAFLIDELLRKKGVRDKTDFQFYTPEPFPLPAGGPNAGASIKSLLAERNISYNPGLKPKLVDPRDKSLAFENGTIVHYDLLVGVPLHTVPKVVKESGLAGPSGWIPVDNRTLRTSYSNVFAIGDVAGVTTANNLLIPRSGILAEEEAKVVANNIATSILGRGTTQRFEGKGVCFMEVGGGKAALVKGDFLFEPSPKIEVSQPSSEGLQAKKEFESTRIGTWFS